LQHRMKCVSILSSTILQPPAFFTVNQANTAA
jgi:hypothetical protein